MERVLDSLGQWLDQFDRAVERGSEAPRVHFAEDPDLVAAWRSASNVIGPPRSANHEPTKPGTAGGEIKPAV